MQSRCVYFVKDMFALFHVLVMFRTYLDEFYRDVTIVPDSPQTRKVNNGNKCIQKETEISLKIHGVDMSYFTESPSIFWVLFFQP